MRVILVLIIALIASPVYASVTVLEKAVYHEFSENNPTNVINKAKASVAGICTSSSHSMACTKISNTYKIHKLHHYGKLCRVTNISITLDVTYHIPKWENVSSTTPEIKKQWDKLSRKIMRHEVKHKEIHEDQFKHAYREIKRLKIACEYINNAVSSIISLYSAKTISKNKKLDRRNKITVKKFPK